jgi:hypothetical protein
VVVVRSHLLRDFPISLNSIGNGGSVPPERKGMEPGNDNRVLRSRWYGFSGSLDVYESYCVIQVIKLEIK